jgi:hypothetical protein
MAEASQTATVIKASADDASLYWLEEGRAPGGFIREVDFAANSRGVDPLFQGIKIVDCDTHFTEPKDLWTANAPAGMVDKMPHVRRIADEDHWYIGDKHFGTIGGNVIDKDKNKLLGRIAFQNYDQIAPGSYDVAERLIDMDAMGVWAQICFQNGGVTQAGSLVALNDEPLALAVTQIFNDACVDRMKESGGRINGMGTLPYWDKDLMNKEMRRIADLGIKGIVLPDRPERISEGYLGRDGKVSSFWEEVFDICNATGIPFNFHLNSAFDPRHGHLGQYRLRPATADQRLDLSHRVRGHDVELHGIGAARHLREPEDRPDRKRHGLGPVLARRHGASGR